MIKGKEIILSILIGSGLGLVSLFCDDNANERSHQLMCYPDSRFINGIYIDFFRVTERIYAIEIRGADGQLTKEGYFNSDYDLNVFDVVSYENGNLRVKNGAVINVRNKR